MQIQRLAAQTPLKRNFKNTQNQQQPQKPEKFDAKPYICGAGVLASAAIGYFIGKKPAKIVEKIVNKETLLLLSEQSAQKCKNILNNMSSHFAANTYKSELEKLNTLTQDEKKYFIKLYEEKTGFPNLEKVTDNIKEHIKSVLNKAAEQSGTKVVLSAYDKNCSIGRKLALPGTDIDEWGLVIDGTQEQINKFKEVLYSSYDQNIVNIICDHPKVYSLEELKNYLNKIDEITNTPEFQSKTQQFVKNINEYTGSKEKPEYITNTTYNIMLADKFPEEESKIRIALDLSSTIETLRDGEVLINNLSETDKALIENSSLYKYGNFLQQKWRNSLKSKHAARIGLDKKYNEYDTDKKIRLIQSFIDASFNNKPSKESEFGSLYNNIQNTDQGILDTVSRLLQKEVKSPI